ncbi:MAG: fumarate hydratase [Thermoplasmatota archaeon]
MMDEAQLVDGIVQLIKKAETILPDDVYLALQHAHEIESGIAKIQLRNILENVKIAKKTGRPLCQDTGVQTFFLKIGEDFPYIGQLKSILIQAVKKATISVPLRPNSFDLFTRKQHSDNVGDYVPVINYDFVSGDSVQVTVVPKGGGSENMSKLVMLRPSDGLKGVKEFVVKEMIQAGGNPCPPTVVGVGIGGGADLAMKLGKIALLRPVGQRHPNPLVSRLEKDLIKTINESNIGPMGLGGKTTVLDVHVEKAPRHPASLPVGMVVQCWADRRATAIIQRNGDFEVM